MPLGYDTKDLYQTYIGQQGQIVGPSTDPTRASAPTTTSLNLGAVLALADDAPERNPRSDAQEVQALMYRDLQRLARRVNRLEQLS